MGHSPDNGIPLQASDPVWFDVGPWTKLPFSSPAGASILGWGQGLEPGATSRQIQENDTDASR